DGPYKPEIKIREIKEITLVLPFHKKASKINVEVVQGMAIIEGDIVLGSIEKLQRSSVVAIDGSSYRWEGGRIPFVISNTFTAAEIDNINKAVNKLNNETNLFLFPRSKEEDFVTFRRVTSQHSNSLVGRQGGSQTIELGDNIATVGVIVHEILHSAGLFHEQSRSDRDKYIMILWDNIESGQAHNFEREDDDVSTIGDYNYCSIMHYGKHAFGKKVNGQPLRTIECKMSCDCIASHSNRDSLTKTDIAGINSIYVSKYSIPWIKQAGSDGEDITVNENGIAFLINTVGKIYRYNGIRWTQLPGGDGISIASNSKKTCMVNSAGKIYRFVNGKWSQMPGSDSKDIAIDIDGTIWMVNTVGKIYKFNGIKWNQVSGSDGMRISAGGGQVWLVNTLGKVYKYNGISWSQMPGSDVTDIAVGNDGTIWVTNKKGYIYKWNGSSWSQIFGSDGIRISANPNKVLLINTNGKIYQLEY
ncbi:MAG TPA: M12 family metallopeptidase, partial [Chitinophagaceae bacterium]|nr:M12 family metallopeptidase [Chitinophagaceae bacterium]